MRKFPAARCSLLDFDRGYRPWVAASHDLVQGADAQPGRTSHVLTNAAPPSVPDATARPENIPNDAGREGGGDVLSELRAFGFK